MALNICKPKGYKWHHYLQRTGMVNNLPAQASYCHSQVQSALFPFQYLVYPLVVSCHFWYNGRIPLEKKRKTIILSQFESVTAKTMSPTTQRICPCWFTTARFFFSGRFDISEHDVSAKFCNNAAVFVTFVEMRHFLKKQYSRTSLIWTPKGQSKVSVLERCPLYRGHEYYVTLKAPLIAQTHWAFREVLGSYRKPSSP